MEILFWVLVVTNVLTVLYAFEKSLEAGEANTRLSRALGESGRVDWSGIVVR